MSSCFYSARLTSSIRTRRPALAWTAGVEDKGVAEHRTVEGKKKEFNAVIKLIK
jgi:hypothetical protein